MFPGCSINVPHIFRVLFCLSVMSVPSVLSVRQSISLLVRQSGSLHWATAFFSKGLRYVQFEFMKENSWTLSFCSKFPPSSRDFIENSIWPFISFHWATGFFKKLFCGFIKNIFPGFLRFSFLDLGLCCSPLYNFLLAFNTHVH